MPMNNSDYWKQRFVQFEKSQNKIGKDTFKEIEEIYRQAQKEIEAKIAVWYQRFAKNNGITLTEARQWLTGKDLKEFKWDVNDYIKYGQENDISKQWAKELENASAKFHISKLEALKINTRNSLEVLFAKYKNKTDSTIKNIYENGYYHTAYEIQKGFNIGFDVSAIDQNKLEKVALKPWAADGYNFSDRIWRNKNKLINEVHTELTKSIMLGSNPKKTIDIIAKKMDTSKYNAGRLVMTESAYFSSLSQKEAYKELGVEQFEILATLDSHTSEICREMDKKHFPIADYQPGITAPPFHVYCRSTTVPYFDDDFGDVGKRAARDEETDKTYYVPADMSYKEWKQAFVDGDKTGLQKTADKDIIKSGARITDLWSKEAELFAKSFYEEIRHRTTDCKKIAENIKADVKDIEKIKNYLFVDKSLYDDDSGTWKRFDEDCAIAHSWQRLTDGKNIKPHDYTLIKHELYEMELKVKNPNITHDDAHELATKRYNYDKEAAMYYDDLKKYKKG